MEFPLYNVLPQYLKGWAYNTDGHSYVSVDQTNVLWLREKLVELGYPNVRVSRR